jgi:hypothetical protein
VVHGCQGGHGVHLIAVRALLVWLLLMAAESVHGMLRTLFLAPWLGDALARQLGVLIGTGLILLITLATIRCLGARRTGQLLAIGALWVVLTVAFEIALGRLILNLDWSRIASDYDLRHGGLMILGLLCMLFAPWVAARLRKY